MDRDSQTIQDFNDRFVRLSVTLTGPMAAEIRRVANNLQLKPNALVRILVEQGLKDNYGIVVR